MTKLQALRKMTGPDNPSARSPVQTTLRLDHSSLPSSHRSTSMARGLVSPATAPSTSCRRNTTPTGSSPPILTTPNFCCRRRRPRRRLAARGRTTRSCWRGPGRSLQDPVEGARYGMADTVSDRRGQAASCLARQFAAAWHDINEQVQTFGLDRHIRDGSPPHGSRLISQSIPHRPSQWSH